MAAKIISDNRLDAEIANHKVQLEKLNRDFQSFTASYKQLPPKERAAAILSIQTRMRDTQKFISTPVKIDMTNAGTRFAFESLKSSFLVFSGRWNKFERSMS